MKKNTTLFGVAFISGLLSACGGGGSGSDSGSPSVSTPPNVPNETISPELSDEFVPFENQSILDKIKDSITGNTSNDTDYNSALGHMIGEAFADYPYGRTARIVQIYNLGINSIKYPNVLCAEVSTTNAVKTLKLKDDKDNCVILDKTYRKGSTITQSVNGDTTTLTFTNVRYGSNVDFNLKDDYLISGSIVYSKSKTPSGESETYKIDQLEFQRIAEEQTAPAGGETFNPSSKEYLQVRNYSYSLVDDYGSGSNGTRTLTSKGLIIGQPYLADFRYSFNFDTTTPFKMQETVLDNYKHLPTEGTLKITDSYNQVVEVKQNQPESLKATVYFNGTEITDLLWSTIIGDKK
ncbi:MULTISPECIES: hypothetical protein [unclassified Acinetobacter]|uniref:hypothetical protein n=1 Tax=unclassified Acinetobacter TaxID=196816 RepID=UPI0025B7D718|nr:MULTISPECIES: hypothetical protein [unclassified Acinetobacter]